METTTIRNALAFGAAILGFFLLAGRWDWIAGWGFVCVIVVANASYLTLLRRVSSRFPSRERPADGGRAHSSRPSVFTYLYLCEVIIGALDGGRFSWSAMPDTLWFAGAGLYTSAFVVVGWCSTINPYFTTVNRIRPEQSGHRLITTGPYMLVRHPGYLVTIIGYVFGTALMLDSWWAFVPGVLAATRLIAATATEDRVLLQTLDDYRAYAARVPYRLFPGIW